MMKTGKKNLVRRAYRFRIYPTKKQVELMKKHRWIQKNLWNDLLAFSLCMKDMFGFYAPERELVRMTKHSGLYSQVQCGIAKRLNQAIITYFRLKKKGIERGFPKYKKSIGKIRSIYYRQFGFKIFDKKIKVTPFGKIYMRKHREIVGRVKTLMLIEEPSGKWYVSITTEIPPIDVTTPNGKKGMIGIDMGLDSFVALSNGEKIPNPRWLQEMEEKRKKLNKSLSRKKKGSGHREKARKRLARLDEKIRHARKDFHHKLANRLASTYSLIAMEDLEVKRMMQERFGKSIGDAGWGQFRSILKYKAKESGTKLVLVNPANTTKRCSGCGVIRKLKLSERTYACPHCGLVIDRDVNAAKNILIRALHDVAPQGPSGCNVSGDLTSVELNSFEFDEDASRIIEGCNLNSEGMERSPFLQEWE